MSFVVESSPQLLQAVSHLTPSQQHFFREQICDILAESPFRYRELIQKNIAADGRVFYQYYDGIVPLVFLYRVYPPEEQWEPKDAGFVAITRADDAWW